MKRFYLIYLLIVFSLAFCTGSAANAQVYGNEWLVKTQEYYQIKVSVNGIYRITYTDLLNAGASPASIDPRKFQIFLNGKEEALYIPGEDDGVFAPGEYIEFFGRKHDGKLDAELYINPSSQPHTYHSLYSDTSVYFLTWSAGTWGKRFTDFFSANYSIPSESWFWHQSINYFPEVYYKGKHLTAEAASLSEYTRGEGWLGAQFGIGTSQTRSLNCPGFKDIGQPAEATVSVFGRSDAGSGSPAGNHHLTIEISPDNSTFYLKKDTIYKGYNEVRNSFNVPASEIGNTLYFKFSSVNNIGAATDFNSVSFIRLKYPRNFDLYNTDSFLFRFTGLNAVPNSYVQFANYGSSAPVLYDLTNGLRIKGTLNASNLQIIIPNAGIEKELFLIDSAKYRAAVPKKVKFNWVDPTTGSDFLIVTHQNLLPGALQYAAYRNGSGYNVLLTTSEDLYNQFFYGQRHPLAVRRFCRFMLEKGTSKPKYLLLLGKGQQTNRVRDPLNFSKDLVPSIGFPPSDAMFTSGLDSTSWEPAIATGRVAARTTDDVINYLEKLISYESMPDSLWRKDILHLGGGRLAIENQLFANSLKAFAAHAVKPYFGANVISYYKNVNEPVTDNLKETILGHIRSGISLLSYFGHGGNLITEINFGQPNEMQNEGRYTTFLLNGCSVGNPNGETSMGEKFMFEKRKAAIAWLANSDLGYDTYLRAFTTEFYKQAFHDQYGKSMAEALKQTVKNFQLPGDSLNQIHCRQYYFQGDPALRFYSPPLPDYQVSKADIFISPDNISALSDSFAVNVIVRNPGKALYDSLSLRIRRTLPDNSVVNYDLKYGPVFNRDTLVYFIKSPDIATRGLNKFEITVDAGYAINESDETNNTVVYDFFMPAHTVNIIFPKNNSIVPDSAVKFIAQANNLFLKSAQYIFELDTVKNFSSPWKITSGVWNSGIMPVWKPVFKVQKGKVYYWRVRFNLPAEEGGAWQEASFTAIPGSSPGWSQSRFAQFADATLDNMTSDSILKSFDFEVTSAGVWIQTRGDDAPTAEERTIRINNSKPVFFSQEFTGFSILSLDPVTLERFSYPSKFNPLANTIDYPFDKYGYSGNFFFNTNNQEDRDSLLYYLQNIPDDYIVMGYNGRNINLENLPAELHQAFETVGCQLIKTVDPGWPYLFYGVKGSAPGTAIEATADTISTSKPPREQQIRVEKEYDGKWDKGSITSSLIGPASSWNKLYLSFKLNANDTVRNDLLGINKNGKETVLFSDIPDSLDISHLNAAQYPFIRIRSSHTDKVSRTPAQLRYWKVLYNDIPEVTFNPQILYSFYKKELQEGDTMRLKVALQNVSIYKTSFLTASYTLTRPDRSEKTAIFGTFQPLQGGDTLILSLALPTQNLEGANKLKLLVQPGDSLDTYAYNNLIEQSFTVTRDQREPLLDVVVDGKHLMNGDIIRPNPLILISSSDENNYLLLNDTSMVDIYLKRPDQPGFGKVSYQSQELQFRAASSSSSNKAVVEYRPGKLADGIYTLKVQAKDASGNYNKKSDYEISFEVVNESTVTHFYPYPNPFTTSMRFVYTLTGQQSPDQLKIQIFNIGGKIVREISQAEFGPMKIGHNVSEFAWDGTDQFGDRLANGVYFYKVLVKMNGTAVKRRTTSADKFIEKDFGKIYLMR